MAERRIQCRECPSYDEEGRRCRIGKANPRKKHDAIAVAELLGPCALCMHSPYREPLLLRMHSPNRRFVWAEAAPRWRTVALDVEILEDEMDADASTSTGKVSGNVQ